MKSLDFLFQRYPLFRYIPGILWMAVIFRASSIPGTGMGWLVPPFDKLVHGTTFAVLAVFFGLWFSNARWNSKPLVWAAVCVLFCVLFGVLDEFHQSFVPGRDASLGDIFADTFGGILGALAYALCCPWKKFRIFREE